VSPHGHLEHYDGLLRIKDAAAASSRTGVPPGEYARVVGEGGRDWSYMKFPYYKPLGTRGVYRVGPLARLNNADACGTPYADVALASSALLQGTGAGDEQLPLPYARLVEIIYAIEMMDRLLKTGDPRLSVRARARSTERGHRRGRGAARTLILITGSTTDGLIHLGQPDHRHRPQQPGDDQSIRQVAQAYVDGSRLRKAC